ncbi:CAP domain-containing protein [uncultured Roseobacter sp.]|uniref:CAP domain-containing protein n=1 Tax=uncultured Roseobacter sp. TaxID=114847 RepID=UPI0026298852|nr:CAP domain-containing protein [uncultured Roseobacter sp.]
MSKASPLEWQMLDLINAERSLLDLDLLRLELRLNDAAEDHSDWMIETDRFSHTGAGGSSPTERMRDADFEFAGSWRSAENIAWQSVRGQPGLSDDVVNLHESLMNSPGHRANILSPNLDVIGIGIERGDYQGWDGLFVTQNFARTAAPLELDSRGSTPPGPTPPNPSSSTLEIGSETVSQSSPQIWHKVKFDQKIEDAVVVMGPVSSEGSDPVTIRVQKVTDTGFEFRMEEWEYLDGRHTTETISWMAVSEGTHQLSGGRTIVAGSGSADHKEKQINLGDDFDSQPLVFTQVTSNRGSDTVASRVDLVDSDSFKFRVQEEEAKGQHVVEKFDWIAIEGGRSGDIWSRKVNGVTDQAKVIMHDSDQALFAQMQTSNGGDAANIRYDAMGARSRIWVDEETSSDAETTHIPETIGVLTADLGTYDLIA